ncbi:MAG: FAD-dependent oxidoreductase [Holosporaceae bacterium]|jgi:2-oxoacid:acceptor oxidoreductase delta subunit (pyruvate/2-ketoisovalerate family)|nr:FAD-dependent oxidoreductase [Holosporaceae bacterium]
MIKPFATVLGAHTSLENKTGSWRTMRPEYVSRIPPCNVACPAGENVQLWLSLAKEKKFFEAWKVMVKDNPFPAVMGRVCYHTCEKVCNRTQFDGAVNINLIERSVGDLAIFGRWSFEKVQSESGKRVLIVGSGPSGLSAAYFLRMAGHDVIICEEHLKSGGMMRYGVPRYRLPTSVLDAEIKRIEALGVKIICGKKIRDLRDEVGNFDAVYIAVGAGIATKHDAEVREGSDVTDAIDLFRKLEDEAIGPSYAGKKVVVCGGGNTAIDSARTALRLGATNVKIVYRRTFNHMSAHETEIKEALEEGVEILCLRNVSVVGKDSVLIDKMNYDEESGVLSKSNETEVLEADGVIFAVGQKVEDSAFWEIDGIKFSEDGTIEIDKNMMTAAGGIFAGGDAVPGKRTVTHAIGHGKKAAKFIDAYLRGIKCAPAPKNEVVNFKKLNTDYYKKTAAAGNFSDPEICFSQAEIVVESSRCFSCGNCFHCDNCLGYCPDNAIIKHPDGSLEINYDYCKGCGICAAECPCGSIKMVPEDRSE